LKRLIVTNNPLVKDFYDEIEFIEGTLLEVLYRARELIQEGYRLVSYPLTSKEFICSPYLSLVLKEGNGGINSDQRMIVENSINRMKHINMDRKIETAIEDGYKKLDFELLKSAFGEEI